MGLSIEQKKKIASLLYSTYTRLKTDPPPNFILQILFKNKNNTREAKERPTGN